MRQNATDSLKRMVKAIVRKALPAGSAFPILAGPLRGKRFIMGSAAGEGGGVRVYFNGTEPEQTRAFVRLVCGGQTVFDIGANIGYYTLLGSTLVGAQGRVVAFEPVVRNLSYLYRHIVLNRVANAIIIPAACSDRGSMAHFSPGDNCAEGHLEAGTDHRDYSPNRSAIVLTTTVDEVVKLTGLAPDVLKIDVEGAELLVLKGARNTLHEKTPVVFLSVHSPALGSACQDFLSERGYRFQLLTGDAHGAAELVATLP